MTSKRIPRKRTSLRRGPVCSVCKHPDRARVEALRLAGASLDNVARKFNISRDSVFRHMANHVSEADRLQYISDIPVQELAARAATEGVSLLDYFSIVRGILLQQFQLCASVNDKNGVAILAGRLTEILRAIGAATGEILKSPTVQNINNSISITNSPVFIDLQQMLIKRLAGHPAALAGVIEGLAELETRSAPRPIAGSVIEHQGDVHANSLDPVLFAKECLQFAADPWQEALLRTTASQTILNCSRQSGKSTCTAVLAVHRAMFSPDSLILLISPSLRQSKELFAKVVGFLKSLQPAVVLDEDNKSSATLANGSRIVSLPGDPKTIRGYSAPSLILEDEAAFVDDEVATALRPMLAVSRGQLILMSTPFGRRGHFFETWQNGGDSWHRISVPASACPRISPEYLKQERESMSTWRYQQEFECVFCETSDQIFSFDTIRAAFDPAVKPLFSSEEIVRMAGAAA